MRTKTFFNYVVAALFCCCVTGMVTSCQSLMDTGSADNPSAENMIKQGVWTEYDTALEASSEISGEQKTEDGLEYDVLSADIDDDDLADIPAVGMKIEGDRAYFFTYSAEGADDLVEGKISYDKDSKKGTIAFPAIKDSPISGQTVSFKMVSDELMQFEFTYEGKKATGSCAWLCKDMDGWGEGDEGDWEELEPYYQAIAETAGPDASIDWSDSEAVTIEEVDEEGNIVEKEVTVTDLDKPLVWNTGASARGETRVVTAVIEGISAGLDIFTSIFEPDPFEEINAKLDAVLGKLDNVLQNQQKMMAQLNEINARLVALAQKMNQQETVNIFNTRNVDFYNKLKVQNIAYFNKAFKLYNDNKSDLSKVKDDLGKYAKEWVGNNEEYINLTWNYIEYLNTVQHSSYGTGMAAIYDGVTFDKYPWEHMGTGDRQNYRANDMFMIAKCLFMINLYAAYGGGSDIKKEGIYNNYNEQKPKLKEFCEFKVSNPNKFLVCQIPGAHFIMHKEIQKYDYRGKDVQIGSVVLKEAPNPRYEEDAVYRPKWHVAGSIKIENHKELKEKLIIKEEIQAIYKYFQSAVYPNAKEIYWYNMLIEGNDIAGGAVYSKRPEGSHSNPILLLATKDKRGMGMSWIGSPTLTPIITCSIDHDTVNMGYVSNNMTSREVVWFEYSSNSEFYAAIVEKRF